MTIFVKFNSGLGNQLFQYAAARALSIKHKVSIEADSVIYSDIFRGRSTRVEDRIFELQALGFDMDYRSIDNSLFMKLRGYMRLRDYFLYGRMHKYICQGRFVDSFSSLRPPALLANGYFQDRQYFLEYEKQIISEVEVQLENALGAQRNSSLNGHYGALHIRRGDYLKHPEFYPQWFEKYSIATAKLLLTEYSCEKVYIFTDDPEWCVSAFKHYGDNVVIRKPRKDFGGAFDLLDMSQANVIAIANSTFSWWAAAIGSLAGASVVAPSRWSMWNQNPNTTLYKKDWKIFDALGNP